MQGNYNIKGQGLVRVAQRSGAARGSTIGTGPALPTASGTTLTLRTNTMGFVVVYPEDAVPYRPRLPSRFWILNSDCWVLVPDSWGRSGGAPLASTTRTAKRDSWLLSLHAWHCLRVGRKQSCNSSTTMRIRGRCSVSWDPRRARSSSTDNSGLSGRHPLKAGAHPMRTTAELEAEAARRAGPVDHLL